MQGLLKKKLSEKKKVSSSSSSPPRIIVLLTSFAFFSSSLLLSIHIGIAGRRSVSNIHQEEKAISANIGMEKRGERERMRPAYIDDFFFFSSFRQPGLQHVQPRADQAAGKIRGGAEGEGERKTFVCHSHMNFVANDIYRERDSINTVVAADRHSIRINGR